MEKTTNHDVKAIEYVLKDIFKTNAELAKVGGGGGGGGEGKRGGGGEEEEKELVASWGGARGRKAGSWPRMK